ncbi:MAG: hypothetical protein WC679_01190 [Bacteroidales bacterium]|jgi:hypothetical protein
MKKYMEFLKEESKKRDFDLIEPFKNDDSVYFYYTNDEPTTKIERCTQLSSFWKQHNIDKEGSLYNIEGVQDSMIFKKVVLVKVDKKYIVDKKDVTYKKVIEIAEKLKDTEIKKRKNDSQVVALIQKYIDNKNPTITDNISNLKYLFQAYLRNKDTKGNLSGAIDQMFSAFDFHLIGGYKNYSGNSKIWDNYIPDTKKVKIIGTFDNEPNANVVFVNSNEVADNIPVEVLFLDDVYKKPEVVYQGKTYKFKKDLVEYYLLANANKIIKHISKIDTTGYEFLFVMTGLINHEENVKDYITIIKNNKIIKDIYQDIENNLNDTNKIVDIIKKSSKIYNRSKVVIEHLLKVFHPKIYDEYILVATELRDKDFAKMALADKDFTKRT